MPKAPADLFENLRVWGLQEAMVEVRVCSNSMALGHIFNDHETKPKRLGMLGSISDRSTRCAQ